MAESGGTRRYSVGARIDIQQILLEAQHRWLRPAEICEILSNYKQFRIAPEPANRPPSGSIFLFDRKVLRYFRKDGHSWRKKRDGKTIKEAHERLKSGSVDVLHCYYAHGEENENFQRRSYWLLEEEHSHIVLVHYLEVKQGNRTNFNRTNGTEETEDRVRNSEIETSVSSNSHATSHQLPTQTVDTISMNSAQTSEYEDVESEYNQNENSRLHSFLEVQQPAVKGNAGFSNAHDPASFTSDYQPKLSPFAELDFTSIVQVDKDKDSNGACLACEPDKLDLPSWQDELETFTRGIGSVSLQLPFSSEADAVGNNPKQGNELLGYLFTNSSGRKQEFGNNKLFQQEWQEKTFEGGSSDLSKWAVHNKSPPDSAYDLAARFHEQEFNSRDFINPIQPFHAQQTDHPAENNLPAQLSNVEHGSNQDGKSMYSSPLKQHLLGGPLRQGSLKKLDSFDRWASKELGDVNEPLAHSSSGAYWDAVESENGVDSNSYMMGPSLSQEQLFSIIDFSPNWVYVGSEIKVLITGTFLKSQNGVENFKWSCMFGEIEVPAEVIADGVLRCHTPLHKAGRVPFYVTCSNRVACSEVREFEYRLSHIQDVNMTDNFDRNSSENLHMRFGKLLCLSSASPPIYDSVVSNEISQLSSKIGLLLKDDNDDWEQMLKFTSEEGFSSEEVKEQLLQKLLKEKLYAWLLQKAAEGGKGPSVLDEGGQGVLHFAAALGYDWALKPTIVSGVSINFRDVNGWTALHWAASCGRVHTVASLICLRAAPGLLTDPTPKDPIGRTPADLASANGHKGIAGFLAGYALSAQLDSLDLEKQNGDATEISGARRTSSGYSATTVDDGGLPYESSLKESLAVVRKATQDAARIHQAFRVQSFHKKQLKEYGDDKFGMSDEQALSLIAVKAQKSGQQDEPVNAAAIRIQNKFRSWKGRKDFLIIRQRIVKIQAHVRGHQVRKNYKKIIWTVGIVEKIILRWRRKRSGLRGFKSEALADRPSGPGASLKEDDDDFFRESRKQTEERSQIALARVKSMIQYPEAFDQYRRLRNVVTETEESKVIGDFVNNPDPSSGIDDLIDLQDLLDDDLFMNPDS